jgi:uncharacterized sporulation protein YeaH/YhbH (DUF444 family)
MIPHSSEDEPESLTIIRSNDSAELKKFKEAARARQDNINERINEFDLIDMRWRYHHTDHHRGFEALVVMVQYDMETTRPLFTIY